LLYNNFMLLYINTTQGHNIKIAIKDGKEVVAQKEFLAKYSQAEKLLPAIDKLLRGNKIKLSDINKVIVANRGGGLASKRGTSFTALRIGVVTANALGYALGVPVKGNKKLPACRQGREVIRSKKFDIIKPIYDKEPNITIKEK